MASVRDWWVRLALAGAVGMIVYFVGVAMSVKFGLLDWQVGFGQLTIGYGPLVIMGVAGFSLLGLLLALIVAPRRGRRLALVALAIPALGLGYGVMAMQQARSVPPIHDIATDLADPPGFTEAVVAQRAAMDANSLDLSDKRVPENPRFGEAQGKLSTDLQRAAYPDIAPIRLAASPEAAFAKALEAAQALGWRVGASDPGLGRFEAQVESFWFGFKDDIAVRVRPDGAGGAIIDVRSVSRVGVSDLGANAARIRAFRDTLSR